MAAHHGLSSIQFGEFGDIRDTEPTQSSRLYQPEGSKRRYELEVNYGSVMARQLGKPDEILPGGRAQKSVAGALHTWRGGTGTEEVYGEGHREVMKVDVHKSHRGRGLAGAMLKVSDEWHREHGQSLSHSAALTQPGDETPKGHSGVEFAMRYPLEGDKPHTKQAQARYWNSPEGLAHMDEIMEKRRQRER